MSDRPVAALVLLTEDTSKQADETLKRVARHLLRAVRESLLTHRLRFEPADEGERPVLAANLWKSAEARHEPKRRELSRSIATKLKRSSDGTPWFVLFHYDGDRAWSQRATSDNVAKFEGCVRHGVRQALADPPQRLSPRKGVAPPATVPHDVDLLLKRLVEVVPFYSIEAWLFRNFAAVKTRCRAVCGGQRVPLIASWEADTSSLDEVLKPKEALCFRDQANAELAGAGFPLLELYVAETSFYVTVESLRTSPGLLEALEQTERA